MEEGGNTSHKEAFAHYHDFKKERKSAKKDWDVRDVYLKIVRVRKKFKLV
jgi:hypothetical protein